MCHKIKQKQILNFSLVLVSGVHKSLIHSSYPQISRTVLGVLADLKNDEVFLILSHPLISSFFSLHYKLLGTVPRVPTIVGITVEVLFNYFFSGLYQCP